MYVPLSALDGPEGIEAEKKRLTFKSKFAEPGDDPITAYRDMTHRGYLAVPRAYGLERFPWLMYDDKRTLGERIDPPPKRPSPYHPAVEEPEQQAKFMEDMIAAVHRFESFLAMAATGSGKTVVALNTAAEFQLKTFIGVHLERLRDQWLDEIKDKLGLPEERIGILQGPTCQWVGKDIVVGMLPSLAQRNDYPREFFTSFGMTIYDEVHRIGAPMLSETAALFPARGRIGLSATPNRRDGVDQVAFYHIGPIRVRSEAKALDCTVYVKRYRGNQELWGKNPTTRAKCLSYDHERNWMLADLVARNYRANRQMLIIGKFIDHLQTIMDMAERLGVPREIMGQFTGERLIRRWDNAQRKFVIDKRIKVKKPEFDRIKRESQLIFATYGMFKEGIDVPRLDCGMDVLPQSEATQVIGRVRRPMEGKPTPYWITIVDENCPISRKQFDKRLNDYVGTGCRIVESRKI